VGTVGGRNFGFPLTWHIAYTTACCYRTSRDKMGLGLYIALVTYCFSNGWFLLRVVGLSCFSAGAVLCSEKGGSLLHQTGKF